MKTALLSAAAALMTITSAAHAAVDIYVSQNDTGVFMQAIGSLDLAGLALAPAASSTSAVKPNSAFLFVGAYNPNVQGYTGFVGPNSFSSDPTDTLFSYASSGTGTSFGFNTGFTPAMRIFLPTTYTSGDAINSTATYNYKTLLDLELPNSGNYIYTSLADTITVHFGQAAPTASNVPEPASWAMMVGGFGLLGAAMRRRKISASWPKRSPLPQLTIGRFR